MKTILGILILVFAFGANAASDIDPNDAIIAIRLEGDQKTEFNVMMRRLNRDIWRFDTQRTNAQRRHDECSRARKAHEARDQTALQKPRQTRQGHCA